MTDENFELSITRVINAPRAMVWKAWSDPVHLVKWWCPKPWTTELRGFDFRPGGAFHTFMRGPDEGRSDNPGAFLDIQAQQRIVWTTALVAGWRPATPWLALTAFITMADEGQSTRYTSRVLHQDLADQNKHVEMGFYDGWGTCIEQLGELAEALAGV